MVGPLAWRPVVSGSITPRLDPSSPSPAPAGNYPGQSFRGFKRLPLLFFSPRPTPTRPPKPRQFGIPIISSAKCPGRTWPVGQIPHTSNSVSTPGANSVFGAPHRHEHHGRVCELPTRSRINTAITGATRSPGDLLTGMAHSCVAMCGATTKRDDGGLLKTITTLWSEDYVARFTASAAV